MATFAIYSIFAPKKNPYLFIYAATLKIKNQISSKISQACY